MKLKMNLKQNGKENYLIMKKLISWNKVLKEQQNVKLLRSQVENEIREEFLNEQDDIQKRIEKSVKDKYELKLKHFQIKENEYKRKYKLPIR